MQIGFLDRTPRGRVATQLAYDHFGITPTVARHRCFSRCSSTTPNFRADLWKIFRQREQLSFGVL